MYWDHFDLKKRPFAIAPDPSLMIWTKQHAQVYDVVKQEVIARAPLTMLTGDVGCGKTTILKSLLEDPVIDAHCHPVLVSIRLGSARELLQHLLGALTGRPPQGTEEDHLVLLRDALDRRDPGDKAPFIILDEAHTMATDVVILLARLARGELTATPPPAVLIAGQPELTGLVSRAECRPLSVVIGKRLRLAALSREDVQDFISGRLLAAGHEGKDLFDAGAVGKIYEYSKGVPRLVNKLCDLCLFEAAQQQRRTLDAEFIGQVLTQVSPTGGNLVTSTPKIKPLDVLAGSFGISQRAASSRRNDNTDKDTKAKPARWLPEETVPAVGKEKVPFLPVAPGINPDRTPHDESLSQEEQEPEAKPAKSPNLLAGYMRGVLVAAVLTVAVSLILPETEGPVAPSEPVLTDSGGFRQDRLQSNAARTPFPVQSQTSDKATTILNGTEPPAKTAVIPAPASTEVLQSEVRLSRGLAEHAAEKLERAGEAPLSREPLGAAAPAATTFQAAAEQNRRTSGLQNGLAPEGALMTLPGAVGTSEKSLNAAELSTPTALQATATEQITASPAADRLPPQLTILEAAPALPPGDEATALYFEKALQSAEPVETALYYARAALRGHRRAAIYLGQLFETGDGVVFNADMAQRWYSVSGDMSLLHQPVFAKETTTLGGEAVAPLGAFVSDTATDLIWHGNASVFTVQVADADAQPIARISTSLNAIRVALPDTARFWRVATENGTTSGWQPLQDAKD